VLGEGDFYFKPLIPAEPRDVIFKNLHYTSREKFVRKCFLFLFSFIFLILSNGFIWGAN